MLLQPETQHEASQNRYGVAEISTYPNEVARIAVA